MSALLRLIRALQPKISDLVKETGVQIRLLTTLALFLVSGATPLQASLGFAPKLQPLASQGTETDDAKPSLTANLLSDATPLQASLAPAPQCQPLASQATETGDAKPSLTANGQVIPNFDAEDRDYMIRTIAFEAAGEPEEGKIAVAHVILNRIKHGGWGDSIKDVVTSSGQFEPWMTKREEMEKLSPNDPSYRDAAQIADAVLGGQMPDPTAGAVYFLNPTVVRERRGGSLPSWAEGEGQAIGSHTFYRPDEGVMLERAALSKGTLATTLSCTRLEAGEASPVG
jgi:spore germination cell wall hydrolase CwlJ-like protein